MQLGQLPFQGLVKGRIPADVASAAGADAETIHGVFDRVHYLRRGGEREKKMKKREEEDEGMEEWIKRKKRRGWGRREEDGEEEKRIRG